MSLNNLWEHCWKYHDHYYLTRHLTGSVPFPQVPRSRSPGSLSVSPSKLQEWLKVNQASPKLQEWLESQESPKLPEYLKDSQESPKLQEWLKEIQASPKLHEWFKESRLFQRTQGLLKVCPNFKLSIKVNFIKNTLFSCNIDFAFILFAQLTVPHLMVKLILREKSRESLVKVINSNCFICLYSSTFLFGQVVKS